MRWRARGGAIVAPDPRAMLALAAAPRARRGVVWAAVLSCALHVALAALFTLHGTAAAPPAEIAPIEVALLREPAPVPAASPTPPAPTPPRVVALPPAPVARPVPQRRVAAKPVPKPVPAAAPAPAPAAVAAEASREAGGTGTPTAAVRSAPPSAGPGRGRGGGDAIASYVASVLRRIEAKKRYPSLARSRGVEGTVVVTLWISPIGGLERVEVGGNASPLLVSSTRDAIEKASPFPPPPDGMPSIRVPIRYALRSGNGSP
jgi:protein TonB